MTEGPLFPVSKMNHCGAAALTSTWTNVLLFVISNGMAWVVASTERSVTSNMDDLETGTVELSGQPLRRHVYNPPCACQTNPRRPRSKEPRSRSRTGCEPRSKRDVWRPALR